MKKEKEKNRTKKKKNRETGKTEEIALSRVRIHGILTSASRRLRQQNSGEHNIDASDCKEWSEDGGEDVGLPGLEIRRITDHFT